jgi:hypothetical protein
LDTCLHEMGKAMIVEKALFHSVVARHSLVGRVARPRDPRSMSAEALLESFEVRLDFSALVCSSAEALPESYGF